MNETAPTPPAVRLARVAFPTHSIVADHRTAPGCADVFIPAPGGGGDYQEFDINSLDDLALAERRVLDAGYRDGHEGYINILCGICDDGCPVSARPEQRATALIALLDAHPELEERLTKHE
jgi:hypothetical protein